MLWRLAGVREQSTKSLGKGGFSLTPTRVWATIEDVPSGHAAPDSFRQAHRRRCHDEQWWTGVARTSPVPRLLDLVREPHTGPYERRTVSRRVNSVGNDDPDILVPMSGKRLF